MSTQIIGLLPFKGGGEVRVKGKISFLAICLSFCLLDGCVQIPLELPGDSYCEISPENLPEVVARVSELAETLSNEQVSYRVSSLLQEEGRLYRDETGCWTYLLATASNRELEILEGAGGVYLDEETLELGDIYWLGSSPLEE